MANTNGERKGLNRQTVIGLTFGQIITVLMFIGGIVGLYVKLQVDIAEIKMRITQNEKDVVELKESDKSIVEDFKELGEKIYEKLEGLDEKWDRKFEKKK